ADAELTPIRSVSIADSRVKTCSPAYSATISTPSSVKRTLARNWETELQPPPALKEKIIHAKLLRANEIVAEEMRHASEGGRPYIEIIEEQREEADRLRREALEAAHADLNARAERALHLVADLLDVPVPDHVVDALSLFDQVLKDASLFACADALFADEHPAVRVEWHAAAFFGTTIHARWGGRWYQRSESNLHFVGPPDLSVLPHKCVARSREFIALYSLVQHYNALELLLTFDSVPSKPRPARPVADFREILRGEHIAKALFEDHLRSGSVRRHLRRTVRTDG
ncbi:MAG: hypothetical protein AAFX41_11515, partial [Bacteroidota bacterium]